MKRVGKKTKSRRFKPGCKAFYVTQYDPRLPHPRQLISRNYEILAQSEKTKALFPRENLVACSKHLPNLEKILSSTLQSSKPDHPTLGQDSNSRPSRQATEDRSQDRLPVGGQDITHRPANMQIGGPPTRDTSRGEVTDLNREAPARRRQGGAEEEALGMEGCVRQQEDQRPEVPPRGQNQDIFPARKRIKGVAELEDGMELLVLASPWAGTGCPSRQQPT